MDSYKRYRCNVLVGLYSRRDAARVTDPDQRGLANHEAITSATERFLNEAGGKLHGRTGALMAVIAGGRV
ncbi:Uncharacterised protein [Pseudomonas fluorescens]|uniref:Uncharacterized protein n=1 Tax=Pseudomonas fluorescens TaxID=294 RepID=A0A3S4PC68_PSEFL|nr:Uncharacterised protein [Pseudomonas fluorescens]